MKIASALPWVMALAAVITLSACEEKSGEVNNPSAPSGGAAGEKKAATATAAASGEPVWLAVAVPLTGNNSAPGIQIRSGAELARDEINADGGIQGRTLELEEEDDGGK